MVKWALNGRFDAHSRFAIVRAQGIVDSIAGTVSEAMPVRWVGVLARCSLGMGQQAYGLASQTCLNKPRATGWLRIIRTHSCRCCRASCEMNGNVQALGGDIRKPVRSEKLGDVTGTEIRACKRRARRSWNAHPASSLSLSSKLQNPGSPFLLPPSPSLMSAHTSSSSSPAVVGVHYQVGKKIGEGSFGVVFEGVRPSLDWRISEPSPVSAHSFFSSALSDQPAEQPACGYQVCESRSERRQKCVRQAAVWTDVGMARPLNRNLYVLRNHFKHRNEAHRSSLDVAKI